MSVHIVAITVQIIFHIFSSILDILDYMYYYYLFPEQFKKFDLDGYGSIDQSELQAALQSVGQDLTLQQIGELVERVEGMSCSHYGNWYSVLKVCRVSIGE